MKRTDLWAMLEKQTEKAEASCRQSLEASQRRLDKLESSLARVDVLYEDYRDRQVALTALPHTVAEGEALRHTMSQLVTLRRRVEVDLLQARHARAQCAHALQKAQHAHLAMSKLLEGAQTRQRREAALKEQASLERQWLEGRAVRGAAF